MYERRGWWDVLKETGEYAAELRRAAFSQVGGLVCIWPLKPLEAKNEGT